MPLSGNGLLHLNSNSRYVLVTTCPQSGLVLEHTLINLRQWQLFSRNLHSHNLVAVATLYPGTIVLLLEDCDRLDSTVD